MRNLATIAALALAGLAAVPSARADYVIGDLRTYDLVVIGNYNVGGDVEGRALIGGNVTGGNGPIGNHIQIPSFDHSDNLIVGGTISNNPLQVSNGNAVVSSVDAAGHVHLNNNSASVYVRGDLGSLSGTLATQLDYASSTLAALASTGTDPNRNDPNNINFVAAPGADGVAVFNVDGSLFAGGSFFLAPNGATSIIINVSGDVVNFSGNFNGLWNDDATRPTVLFNFYQATTLNVDTVPGAVLAPYATLHNSNAINGPTYVLNFNQGGEIHLPTQSLPNRPGFGPDTPLYTGIFPVQPVPEPTSLALIGVGLGLGLALAWRGRRPS
jgi:choice-of-anchor A domain-containing protein